MAIRNLLLSTVLCPLSLVRATCYLPNGRATDYTACNSTAEFSACCSDVDMCTNQGFCKNPSDTNDQFYWRDSCTDPTWESDACPKYCYNSSTAIEASERTWLLLACSQTTFCCTNTTSPLDPSCCDYPDRVFDAGPASYGGGVPGISTLVFHQTMTTSSVPTNAQTPPTSTTSALQSSTTPAPQSSTTSALHFSTASAVNHSERLRTGAATGIGVGVALGVLAIAGLIGLAFMIKRRTSSRRQTSARGAEKPLSPWTTSETRAQHDNWKDGIHVQQLVEADPHAVRGFRPVELPNRTSPPYRPSESKIIDNTRSVRAWPHTVCDGEADPCTQPPSNFNLTTIDSIAQAIYTADLATENTLIQNLEVALAFEQDSVAQAACWKEAPVMDSLATVGAFLATIGAIPGFEWIEFESVALNVANVDLAGGAEAVSLVCEITEVQGAE